MTTAQAAVVLGLAPATVQRLGQEYNRTNGRVGLRRGKPGGRFFTHDEVVAFDRQRVARQYIVPILDAIRRYAHRRGVALPTIALSFSCPVAALDHKVRSRYLAHAFHREWLGQNSICMVPEIARQPLATAAGVTLHEVGHVMCQKRDPLGAEPLADQWVRDRLGLEIHYSPKTTIQYLDRRALRALGLA